MTKDPDCWMWIVLGLVLTVLVCGLTIKDYYHDQVKIEAIRAGLVQDKDGHWVRVGQEKP
jgi:hypothetical protein